MDDLFSDEKLTESVRKEIGLIREWLNSVERDVDAATCVEAGLLIYLGQSFTKLTYVVGMLNKTRLSKQELPETNEH